MATYLVAHCAQCLSRYAKQAECRLLLSLIPFAYTVLDLTGQWYHVGQLGVGQASVHPEPAGGHGLGGLESDGDGRVTS